MDYFIFVIDTYIFLNYCFGCLKHKQKQVHYYFRIYVIITSNTKIRNYTNQKMAKKLETNTETWCDKAN